MHLTKNQGKTGFGGYLPYSVTFAPRVEKLLVRMKKRDVETYKEIAGKISKILDDPYHFGKPIRSGYKGLWEVHVKNNLLYYRINDSLKSVEMVAYVDHDTLR